MHIRLGRAVTFAVVAAAAVSACRKPPTVDDSVAQVERVRAGVAIAPAGGGSVVVTNVRRVAANDAVRTDATGRAIVALDGGGRYVVDHDTTVRLTGTRAASLEAGRVWIAGGGEGGRQEDTLLAVGDARLHLRGARAGVERASDGHATVSVLAGEIAFESGSQRGTVHAGERAELTANHADIAAQRLFEDWTGGLADDLPAGNVSDAAGLGALAARRPDETGAPRWPMVMQRIDAHVVMHGDLAITTLDQTFFNPSADTVEGIYTFHTPPGAVLQAFGVDRHGRTVEGVVHERQQAAAQYQAQVYAGSTHDPALLEWDAPGRYHARLYPIAPGSTRRIRVRYTQWLDPDPQGRRVYRLPLASLETRVGELRADFDLENSAARRVRTGEGARIDNDHLYITRSDVIPRADLVVELHGEAPGDVSATRVSAAGGGEDGRGNYLRLAVRAPAAAARDVSDQGVDLVVVVDHSAATDALALRLEQAFVESLVRQLDARDNVLVLAGDVATRPLGWTGVEMRAATPANQRLIVDALNADPLGGATDLGAMVTAAQGALRPGRNGAVVYVGDGNATVGEAQLPALRQQLARLSPRPRLYAIAVGEDPRLDLLEGLAAPAGFAARVARRGDVARTALDLVEHASRPLVRNFRVDLGSSVQTVYPNEPVDLPAGEPLVVVGRFRSEPPRSLTVHAQWNGAESTRTATIDALDLDDAGDLRFRWANARLQNLLARGESRPVIVELGTRYGLITPFTSLYVASEDEVSARETAPAAPTRLADLSPFDLLPLVGCESRRAPDRAASAAASAPPSASTPTSTSVAADPVAQTEQAPPAPPSMPAGNAAPARMGRMSAHEAASNRGIFAAPAAPAGGAARSRETAQEPAAAEAPMPSSPVAMAHGASAAAHYGATNDLDTLRDGVPDGDERSRLGARGTGAGGGGSGEGTIGLGTIGTMGHGASTGSGQGYGSGAGRGLLGRRGASGPAVHAQPPTVEGQLAPEAVRRVVLRHLGQVNHCYEMGLAQTPGVAGRVVIQFTVRGTGEVSEASVGESNLANASIGPCIASAVQGWQFPAPQYNGVVSVSYPFVLSNPGGDGAPNINDHGTTTTQVSDRTPERCSDAASVSLDERTVLWRERLAGAGGAGAIAQVYRAAGRACELRAWPDRVALLRLMAASAGSVSGQLALYSALAGDGAARAWVRDVVLRQLARTGELAQAFQLGLGTLDADTMVQALAHAATPADRLGVLTGLWRRYPDDMGLGQRALATAVEAHDAAAVHTLATQLRAHPQADAQVRTAAGEALLAVGDEAEARRAFSEIVEFAPDDPAARRRLGDIALSHGWADEAYRQFQMLAAQEDDAPEVLLRQAMAARMAGRLDEAIRLAQRVAEQSSADGSGGVGDVAAAWISVELARAATEPGVAPDTLAALRARWRRSAAARASGAVRVLLRWYHPDDGAELSVTVPGEAPHRADLIGTGIFLESTVLADAPASLALDVRRATGARPSGRAQVLVLWNEGTDHERLETLDLAIDDTHQRYELTATPAGSLVDATPAADRVPPELAATDVRAPNGGAR